MDLQKNPHQITRKIGGHLSPMILHSVCLILCLKWHETCPACSSRLPYCVPWDLPTPDTWPKGSNQQSDLIGEDGLGLLGLWNAKEETDVSSWYWRHGGRHKVFQGVAPRSRTKEIYMFLLAFPELLGSHHNRPCCVVLDCWQLSSSVYVCPQNRHPPTHTHAFSQHEWVCAFFEICQEPIAFYSWAASWEDMRCWLSLHPEFLV